MTASKFMCLNRPIIWGVAISILICLQSVAMAAQVSLAWEQNSPDSEYYRIFQRTEGESYNYASPAWSGTTTECSIGNLVSNVDYYFVVRAYAGDSASVDSNEVAYRYDGPQIDTFTITASAGPNGEISHAGSLLIVQGASQTFNIDADERYYIDDVLVDGESVGALNSYTFNKINANHSISVSFAENPVTIPDTTEDPVIIPPANDKDIIEGSNASYVWIEAEDGDISYPMQIEAGDGDSSGDYVQVDNAFGHAWKADDQAAGVVEYQFYVPVSGTYMIWGRTLAADNNSDSFWVSLDGGQYALWDVGRSTDWLWDAVSDRDVSDPVAYQLTAGSHTVVIKHREDGTMLDKLLITNDLTFMPE